MLVMEFIDAPVILDVPRDLFGVAVTDFLDLAVTMSPEVEFTIGPFIA